jgi:hypothetical protein
MCIRRSWSGTAVILIFPLEGLTYVAARVTPSSASATPSYSDTQQEGDQQGAERRFPCNVAQDAERHAGLSTFLDRIANAIGGAPDSFGNLFNRRLRRWTGIQAFIHKRWGGHVIGHGRTS